MKDIYVYIILTIPSILLFILLLINIFKNDKKEDINNTNTNDLNEFKLEVLNLISESNLKGQTEMVKSIDSKFDIVNKSVNETITKSFKKTDQTFINVVERLTKIDQQHQNINKLSKEVLSLNNILTDKLTRGTFGEVQLYKLLEAVYGNNEQLYQTQVTLSNGTRPDALIHAPKPLGSIAIDSKFPLENYQRYIDHNNSNEDKRRYKNMFNTDLKKHIRDIKSKYIIEGHTAKQAIMFIPAESIYIDIISNHYEIIDYAYDNNIWITSPTTLISQLTIIESVSNSIRQTEQTTLLVDELKYLSNEFRKYRERSLLITKRIEQLNKDINDLNTTNDYIHRRFKEIEDGKLD